MEQPNTIQELAAAWRNDIETLNQLEPEVVAGYMVGRLAGNDNWDEWYGNNPTVTEIFDLVADLELPKEVSVNNVKSAGSRDQVWERVKELVSELESI